MDQRTRAESGIGDARAFVEQAYRSRSDDEEIDHALAVAQLLHQEGQAPVLVIAGLLHDVVEDTDVSAEEVRDRFGPEVARIVEALTQDPSISGYEERKAALRRQIVEAGRDAATVALADKAAKIASLHSRPRDNQFEHYRATLDAIEERYGRSPLSERARADLERLPPSE
jgi:GTP diphosphokinase / guanosine-3',5'-bis(diphosphate) 3'-diphosphatase